LLLILANGVFAMSELALVSARKTRLQQWANQGDARARAALELARKPAGFLSTTQIGITLVGILAGAFGGATVAEELAGWIAQAPVLAGASEALALAIVVTVTTFFSLVLGELAPKRLALSRPERISRLVARPMQALARVTRPLVQVLSFSTDVTLRIMRVRPTSELPVSEEEIRALIAEGRKAGTFEAAEQELVERVFRLNDRRISALMTPRSRIAALDVRDPPPALRQKIAESRERYYLVTRGGLGEILGVVSDHLLFRRLIRGQPLLGRPPIRRVPRLHESMRALEALEALRSHRAEAAVVIDEYGDVQGLVSVEDILTAIAGEAPAAWSPGTPQAVRRADGTWLLDGMLLVDDLKSVLAVGAFPGEPGGAYQTLGGFVMAQLGRVPREGDAFDWQGLRFEVVDMDARRVGKVLASPREPPAVLAEQPPD